MSINLAELNSLVTRSDLLEFERRIESHLAKLQEVLTKIRTAPISSSTEQIRKEYYSPAEFAPIIGRSKSTVVNWCHEGRITALQPGGHGTAWMIPATVLTDFEKDIEDYFK